MARVSPLCLADVGGAIQKSDEKGKKEIYDFYLSQTGRINNWDLVDLSAPGIVGEYLKDKLRKDLYRLADSPLLWDQRIAVVSTYTLIKMVISSIY